MGGEHRLDGAVDRDVHGGAGEVRERDVVAATEAQPARVLVEPDLRGVARREVAAGGEERGVEVAQAGRIARAGELGPLERRRVLGVRDLLAERGERGELAAATLARGDRDLLVDVVAEELERRVLADFLAL